MKNLKKTTQSTAITSSKNHDLPLQHTAQKEDIPPLCDKQTYELISCLCECFCEAEEQEVVIVCFGTSTISGDALGPKIGTLLRQKYNLPVFVYGTEDNQINGKNMHEWLSFITAVHQGALFVSVDASLGSKDKVGQIIVRDDGVCPSGVTGKKERFGDIGILGVVAQKQGDAIMQLMSVSPLYIDNLADKICVLLQSAFG